MRKASLADKYTYRVVWSEEDGEFVGLGAEFPSLSWPATSQDGALRGVVKLVKEALADMQPPRRGSRFLWPRRNTAVYSRFVFPPSCTATWFWRPPRQGCRSIGW